jgi:fermentation-respiration switch protein FrsA (DUF1100 family)
VTIPPSLIRITLTVALVYVAICVIACVMQRKMMYFPATEPVAPEKDMQDVTLQTSDGVPVKATWWPGRRKVAIVLFHGNAGNRGDRFDWMRVFHSLGWSVFLLDYRGYGGSKGEPSEAGLGHDADASVAWLKKNAPDTKLVYFGESIGGSVAMGLAARHRPAGIILQSTALDLSDVARKHYPILPIGLILSDKYDSRAVIGKLDVPLLSIHGDRDDILPMRFGRAAFDAAPGPKEWYTVEGAGHNDLIYVGGRPYYEKIHAFLESIEKG